MGKRVRPNFSQAWSKFMEVNLSIADVGAKIGGRVQDNIKGGIFLNACPIRMSYVLNQMGVPIPSRPYAAVTGADHRWYLFRVREMMTFLEETFGKPDQTAKSPKPADFENLQGILVVRGTGWDNALGHVTLWNGKICSDACHMLADPDNGTFIPESGALWTLP